MKEHNGKKVEKRKGRRKQWKIEEVIEEVLETKGRGFSEGARKGLVARRRGNQAGTREEGSRKGLKKELE